MRKTRIYTDYVYRSQTEHLHFGPSHDLINVLNSSSDMSALHDVGKIFQIFAPKLLKDLRPYWISFTFGLTSIELSLNA